VIELIADLAGISRSFPGLARIPPMLSFCLPASPSATAPAPQQKEAMMQTAIHSQRPSHRPPCLPDELLERFFGLCQLLSPDNRHAAGVHSYAQVQRMYKQLSAEWTALEQEAGRKVTPAEVQAWHARCDRLGQWQSLEASAAH
jgi:hypothetical protein